VPFGSFILEMKALNLKGIESNTLAVPLHAFPPLWRRTWFAMVASLIMVIGLYVIYRIRLKQLLKQSTRKAQDLQIQNDLLRLEQQALRLQMNPHFIFNALQSIQIRMREGKTAEAETHLRKFGDLMRSLLDQSRRDSISLEDEIQSLNVYLEIERSIRSERFDFSITAPAESDLSFYHIPPMVIQPFVENAVKHGLPVNGSNGDIQIKMRLKGRYLECTVRDNGPGMARATQPVHQSAGIQVTADRLRSLSSSSSMDPVKIETLRNDEMVTGTMVTLSIPIIEEEA
jgi:sensor histidine kinase YesM